MYFKLKQKDWRRSGGLLCVLPPSDKLLISLPNVSVLTRTCFLLCHAPTNPGNSITLYSVERCWKSGPDVAAWCHSGFATVQLLVRWEQVGDGFQNSPNHFGYLSTTNIRFWEKQLILCMCSHHCADRCWILHSIWKMWMLSFVVYIKSKSSETCQLQLRVWQHLNRGEFVVSKTETVVLNNWNKGN